MSTTGVKNINSQSDKLKNRDIIHCEEERPKQVCIAVLLEV